MDSRPICLGSSPSRVFFERKNDMDKLIDSINCFVLNDPYWLNNDVQDLICIPLYGVCL